MAVATTTSSSKFLGPRAQLEQSVETGTANAQLTATLAASEPRQIVCVGVTYSASASVTVAVNVNSGGGAAYDFTLGTIALTNETTGSWIPTSPVYISDIDALDVVAPAGGADVTAAVSIYTMRD